MGFQFCSSCGKKAGNGAATLQPQPQPVNNPGSPTVIPQYPAQAGVCSGGSIVPQAPYLVTPEDYASLPPLASVLVIDRRGRQHPNNRYVFTPTPPGVVQVQSPKVGRY